MTKKKVYVLTILTFLLIPCLVFADPRSFILNMLGECLITSDYGNPVETYEDVEDITNIFLDGSEVTPILSNKMINDNFNHPVKKETGDAFINAINSTGGRIVSNAGGDDVVSHFIKKYVTLEAGGWYEDEITGEIKWNSREAFTDFKDPIDYSPGEDPHTLTFYIGIKGGWKYIPKDLPENFGDPADLAYPPYQFSCDVAKHLCDYSPGNCVREEREDADENDNGIFNELITSESHVFEVKVYKNLANYLINNINNPGGPGFDKDYSQIKSFKMIFEDRTPPIIQNCIDGVLPELGKPIPATTGDLFKTVGLEIVDNKSSHIGVCIALGRIDGYPSGAEWRKISKWDSEKLVKVIPNNSPAQYIILPNKCHGVMEYALMTWDKKGLLNPSDPCIVENKPRICYGLQTPPSGYRDLRTEPDLAKEWPPEYTLSLVDEKPGSVNVNALDTDKLNGKGLIHIRDNDLPNLVIKIKSVKDESSVFFPPIVKPDDLSIYSSPDYKSGTEDANEKDYVEFIEKLDDNLFTSSLVDETKSLYFKVLQVEPSSVMDFAENSFLDKFKHSENEANTGFLLENFRLENYEETDTDNNGELIKDGSNFGRRNGFGKSAIAVLDPPLQEDVEYIISVWSDDNVKWVTIDESETILEEIYAIPTGINDAWGKVDIPNQHPKASYNIEFDKNNTITKELKVVFREPTKPLPKNGTADDLLNFCNANKIPSIEVWVEDFAKLRRKIKLFLPVSDENPNIRVIERQHQKR
jgi:hypothetical protein